MKHLMMLKFIKYSNLNEEIVLFYIDKMHKRKHYRDQHIYRIVGNDKMIFFYICLPCFNTLMSVKGAHLSLLVNLIKNIV